MKNNSKRYFASILVVAILGILAVSAFTGAAAAQTNNTTATPDSTPTAEPTETSCSPSGPPEMSQSRLYAQEETLTTDSPGRIAGGFQVNPTYECPVTVFVTLQVPSGMEIRGSSDAMSGGAGLVSTQFEVSPGANIRSIAANVYSSETGSKTVIADIQMWPTGHEDMSRSIDGLTFRFDVENSVTPTESSNSSDSSNEATEGAIGPGFGVLTMIASTLIIGLYLYATRRN
jgi:hypothetical protein